ncbi:MAG TPA: YceD family protein [Burkholderiaceae bacterium]|nr:YceD family protein [Burkholderiaceae bacterium]
MMPARPTFDAFRLAHLRESLCGVATMVDLPRLAQSVLDPAATVHYDVEGRVDDAGHPGAVMKLAGCLPLRCERCNAPLQFMLERDVPFRFVHDEQELNALPIEDVEVEDVVGSPATDLLAWVEDEAILSLPLVPRHEDCAVPYAEPPEPADPGRPNPFAALAKLKRGAGGGMTDG